MKIHAQTSGASTVPPRALLLSLLCLGVPVLSSALFPSWTSDIGALVWLLALIPPFLLSYYHGWGGASLALAAGMAALTLGQLASNLAGAALPRQEVLLAFTVVLIVVSLGTGALSALFRKKLEEAQQMALTDAATGLPNRRHGEIHLNRAVAAAQRGEALSVVLFDLDHFKRLNDSYGHRAGDEAIRVFAAILVARTRTMHLSVRYGGEEFLAILDGVTATGARVMAERVLDGLRQSDMPWGPLTCSAGVAEYEAGMTSGDDLVAAADQALYRAKGAGRDRVAVLERYANRLDTAAAGSAS